MNSPQNNSPQSNSPQTLAERLKLINLRTKLTTNETCLYGRCSRNFLYNLEKQGKLKYIKIGGKKLYDKGEIDALFEQYTFNKGVDND